MIKKILLAVLTAFALVGCTPPDIFNERGTIGLKQVTKDANLVAEAEVAAAALIGQAAYLQNQLRPILITSIVDINNLNETSDLGLLISEYVGNRFAQTGFPIVDIRSRDDIAVRELSGEFALSRDIKKLSKSHAGSAILVGTYAKGTNEAYLSLRLVRPSDDRVIATHNFSLPIGPNTRKLLR